MNKINLEQPVADYTKAIVFSRPEHELLICSARTQPDDLIMQRITALLQEDLDWDYVIQLARQHWIMPLLYLNVNEVDDKTVPTSVLEQLRDNFRENAKRNLFFTGELVKILESFSASGIPVIPYKGPILAQFAYENIALRTFADLDVLVDLQHLDLAKRELLLLGYEPYKKLDKTQEWISLLSSYERLFTNRFNAVDVEVHWAAWKKNLARTPSQSDLWRRVSTVTLFGTDIAAPSPEDMILLSIIHGTKHVWTKLQLICDIAELIRSHPKMNWHLLMEQAHRLGNQRMLLLGLLLANDFFKSAVPPSIRRQAQDDSIVEGLATHIERRLFQNLDSPTGHFRVRSIQLTDLPFVLRLKERVRDQALSILGLTMLPTLADYEAVSLPAPLIGLYFFVHPALILKRYLSREPHIQAV